MRSSKRSRDASKSSRRSRGTGPLAFVVSVIILALGGIQLVSAFHTYALSLAELNGLKRQEAALVEQKRSLENEIARWSDKSYVTAQARERLGFVFPGEVSVHVNNSQSVSGKSSDAQSLDKDDDTTSSASTIPWYSELAYGIRKADEPTSKSTIGTSSSTSSSSTSSSSSSSSSPSSSSSSVSSESTE